MKNTEYQEMVDKALALVKADCDAELCECIEAGLEAEFRKLPMHKETIRTLRGVIGYHACCGSQQVREEKGFVSNALHDLRECVRSYTEPWFCPRLSRFAK